MATLKKPCIGRIVMIHGIQERSPAKHLGKLASFFRREGFTVIQPRYGNMGLLTSITMSRWINPRIADSIASFILPDDILCCHSNGATIAYLISQRVRIRGTILINPALDVDKAPLVQQFNHVYFNPGDWVVWLSAVIPFNKWGAMGHYGYRGTRTRHDTLNIDCSNPPYDALPALSGHSALFHNGNLAPWARYMADLARSAIESHSDEQS